MNVVELGNKVNHKIMIALEESREKAFLSGIELWTVDSKWLDDQVIWMKEVTGNHLSDIRLREHLVCFILREFTASIFGVDNGVGR